MYKICLYEILHWTTDVLQRYVEHKKTASWKIEGMNRFMGQKMQILLYFICCKINGCLKFEFQ